MNYIREIWFPNREQSKVFKAIFILGLYAKHSFIFVNNTKLSIEGTLPCMLNNFFRKFCL